MTVPLYALTDTWNASGTVWQGIELDVTDTGSDPTSVLFKLTRNSNNYFQIDEVGQTSISLGTITANAKALNITATWNNNAVTFDAPLFMNITNTASNAASLLMDLQVGSASKFSVTADAAINLSTSSNGPTTSVGIASLATSDLSFYTSGVRNLILSGTTLLGNTLALASNFGNYQLFSDTSMYRDAGAGLWGFARGANGGVSSAAATIRVYNTTDNINTNVAPTNYERAVFDWTTTANTLTIATQKGGTGSNRNIEFTSEGSTFIFSGNGLNPSIFFGSSSRGSGSSGDTLRIFASGGMRIAGAANPITWGTTTGGSDIGIGRIAAGVLAITDGSFASTPVGGWINYVGQTRVTADVNSNNTTTLAAATGLSVALQAGHTYQFDVYLSFTCTAAQGIRAAMVATGGLTATAIEYDGWILDSGSNGVKGNTQSAALGTVVANAPLTGTAGVVIIKGIITVNVAGTLNVQFAQSVAAANNTTVKRGSYMLVQDMP